MENLAMIDINLYAKRRRTSIFDIIKYKKLSTYLEFRNFCVAHKITPPSEETYNQVFKKIVEEAEHKHDDPIITKVNVTTTVGEEETDLFENDVSDEAQVVNFDDLTKKDLIQKLDDLEIKHSKYSSKKQLVELLKNNQ